MFTLLERRKEKYFLFSVSKHVCRLSLSFLFLFIVDCLYSKRQTFSTYSVLKPLCCGITVITFPSPRLVCSCHLSPSFVIKMGSFSLSVLPASLFFSAPLLHQRVYLSHQRSFFNPSVLLRHRMSPRQLTRVD